MPRIDQVNLKKGKFKKTTVRSWDDDLITSLKISSDKKDNEIKEKLDNDNLLSQSHHSRNTDEMNLAPEKLGSSSQLEFNKSSGSVVDKKQESNVFIESKDKPLKTPQLEFNKSSNSVVDEKQESNVFVESKDKPLKTPQLEFNKSSNSVVDEKQESNVFVESKDKPLKASQLEFNKSSSLVDEEKKKSDLATELKEGAITNTTPSFLDDDFRFKKIMTRLSGHEKKVLLVILRICLQKNSTKTGSISSEDFDNYLKINRNSRETALKRLCKKGLLKRFTGKRGVRGTINIGFVSELALSIADQLYQNGEFNTLIIQE